MNPQVDGGGDAVSLVLEQRRRIRDFTDKVRSGEILGHTGRPIKNIISVVSQADRAHASPVIRRTPASQPANQPTKQPTKQPILYLAAP